MNKDDDLESWEFFVYETEYPWCWACGRIERPLDWYATWVCPQRAHIGSGGGSMKRRLDRRQAVLLCPLCHGKHRPRARDGQLSNGNMIWLKRRYDPQYYDHEYIQRYWIGIAPDPEPPAVSFTVEYERRHGKRPTEPEAFGPPAS